MYKITALNKTCWQFILKFLWYLIFSIHVVLLNKIKICRRWELFVIYINQKFNKMSCWVYYQRNEGEINKFLFFIIDMENVFLCIVCIIGVIISFICVWYDNVTGGFSMVVGFYLLVFFTDKENLSSVLPKIDVKMLVRTYGHH